MKQLLTLILISIKLLSFAQKVEFTASVNKKEVAVNEIFTYEIYSNANCQIYQPNFGNLQVVGGPYQSSSSSTIRVNGKTTFKRENKYTFKLRANKAGTYTIGKAVMNCDLESYSTQSITIKVVKGTNRTTVPSHQSNFFINVYASKKTVYQGEPFTITLKMYSKQQPRGIEELEIGDANGISKKDLNPDKTSFETKQEIIDGVRYYTVTLKSELCFALTSGKLTIEPYHISALFSRGFFQQHRLEGYSKPITITVKPLPKPKPKDFNGLVGNYTLEHSISKTEVLPGEAIDISLKISGKGNLNAFDEPKLKLPNDFDQFDPEYKQNYKATSSGYNGSITYNLVIVPTFYGDYIIPAFSFSYFDIDSKTYKTLTTGDFNIKVNKPKDGYGEIITNKREAKIEENDIRYIHTNSPNLFKSVDLWAGSTYHILLVTLPFFAVWLILFIRKKQANLSDDDKKRVRAKKAKKAATTYLSDSKKLSQKGEYSQAVKSLSQGLKSYIKNKFSLTEYELNAQTIKSKLKTNNLQDNFDQLWRQIEMYQYAPVSVNQLDELIEKTETLINQIEKQ